MGQSSKAREPRRLVGAATALALLVLGTTSAPGASAAEPELTVSSVTVSRAAVTVSGVNTVRVDVQVTANVPSASATTKLMVYLERQGPGGSLANLYAVNLPRTSGTGDDGVWAGPLWVPSTANGPFKVTAVSEWFDDLGSQGMVVPTPYDGPALQVTGVHQPVVSATTSPNPVPAGASYFIVGRVLDAATGQPYASTVGLEIGVDNTCVESAGVSLRTNTSGTFALRLPPSAFGALNCAFIRTAGVVVAGVGFFARRPGDLSAAPTRASTPAGSVVTVEGRARNAALCPVVLQRLQGATQWRGVSLARVRASGRLTLQAPLGARGAYTYRVHLPVCNRMVDATTARFAIRAT
jgi:hypothetical protein